MRGTLQAHHAAEEIPTVIARDELVRGIRLGENLALELKRVLLAGFRVTALNDSEFADDLAAMANGWGGTAVLGVEDNSRDILGIPLDRLDAVETWVRDICNDSVKPPLDALIRKMELPGAEGRLVPVLCVEVARSLFVHKSPGGYFRRIGTRSGRIRRKYSRGSSRSGAKAGSFASTSRRCPGPHRNTWTKD